MPPEVYPVHQVTRYLRELLETNRHLTGIWINGEISNLAQASSGHVYFTLKDQRAALRCAFFRSRNVGQRQLLAEGQSIIAYGSLSLYEQRGNLSFVVEFVRPEGEGALAAEFERLRAKLEEEGIFALERKRPLPRFPERIGVVTSPTGAVLHDILDVLGRRWPLATVLVQPAPVQGDSAGPLIAEALRSLTAEQRPDVVILARGGGSAEDLWAFNGEPVPRAIFASPVPVVSAVGHETDTTLADLAADCRAPTPSAAAELVAPDRVEVAHRVEGFLHHSELRIDHVLAGRRRNLDRTVESMHEALPDVALLRAGIHAAVQSGGRSLRHVAEAARARTLALRARLDALSPLATLERGYAAVTRADGTPVGSAATLLAGDAVRLRFRDGERPATIEAATR